VINQEEAADGVLQGFANEKTWWLCGGSHPVQVVDAAVVTVLIKATDGSPILVRFKHGDGTVYHMTSHFHLQQGQKPAVVSRRGAATQNAMGDDVLERDDIITGSIDLQERLDQRERPRSRSPSNRSPANRSPARSWNPFANMSNPFSRKPVADQERSGEGSAAGGEQVQAQAAPIDAKEDEEEVGYSAWAMSKGAKKETLDRLQATKESQERDVGGSEINYRNLQNAACASEFVVRSVLQQKTKARK